jgi:hypothetical protein
MPRIFLIHVQDPAPNTGPTDWVSLDLNSVATKNQYTFFPLFFFGMYISTGFGQYLNIPRTWALVILLSLIPIVAWLAWLISSKIRRKAIQELQSTPDLPLTKRVLISGFIRQYPLSFDADLWINETGPHGPRTVLGNITRPLTVHDGAVFEEVDIDSEVASTNIRRKHVIVLLCLILALGALLLWWVGMKHTLAMACYAPIVMLLVVGFLGYYGLNPVLRRVSIATLGKVEVTSLGRTTTYTRENSVLFVVDQSAFTERIDITVVRRDGHAAYFRFPNPRDPTLAKLIARWTHPARPTT